MFRIFKFCVIAGDMPRGRQQVDDIQKKMSSSFDPLFTIMMMNRTIRTGELQKLNYVIEPMTTSYQVSKNLATSEG